MARPARNARLENVLSSAHTFFATTKTSQGRASLQSDRNATLMIDVLRSYVKAGKFRLHDFVIMPNHLHLLLTVGEGEVWQRGFSESRVVDRQSFLKHREYIAANPVKAGLVDSPEAHPYSFSYLAKRKAYAGDRWRNSRVIPLHVK